MVYTYIAILIFIGALFITLQWLFGVRRIPLINEETEYKLTDPPLVSIIIAAKNEDEHIKATILSLLVQTYTNMEIIIVNDRSTDKTTDILNSLLPSAPNIKVIHVEKLPNGWLGKNHALYIGSKNANGDWLLFADADVTFKRKAIENSVAFVTKHSLDHLTLMPENIGGTLGYRTFHSYWSVIGVWNFIQLKHAGIGAFNMIKREVYEKIGTHKALPLAPDDDLKLGKLVVSQGYDQRLGFGKGIIEIQWYENITQVIKGLEKNLFAFMRYQLLVALFFSIVLFLVHILPFTGIFFANPVAQLFHAFTILLYAFIYLLNRKYFSESAIMFLTIPFIASVFIYCILRSAFLATWRGKIEWRGTSYSLEELREHTKKNIQ